MRVLYFAGRPVSGHDQQNIGYAVLHSRNGFFWDGIAESHTDFLYRKLRIIKEGIRQYDCFVEFDIEPSPGTLEQSHVWITYFHQSIDGYIFGEHLDSLFAQRQFASTLRTEKQARYHNAFLLKNSKMPGLVVDIDYPVMSVIQVGELADQVNEILSEFEQEPF